MERRIKVPKGLPGYDVPMLQSPDKNKLGDREYTAAIEKLYPKLSAPPPVDEGPLSVPRMRMSLTDLEQLALANSPIIPQFQADVSAQAGQAIQAGTHPNPIIGYEADTVGSFGTRNYQGVYATQLIKTAGKLQVAQAIENVDLMNTQLALRQARYDLLTQVRRQYFALLIARESVKINTAIVRFTHELYQIQKDQFSVGLAAAYEPPFLRTFAEGARADLVAAQNEYRAGWQQLRALLNAPDMPVADLVDQPDMPVPVEDYNVAVSHVLSMHTEAQIAHNGISKGKLALRFAQITPIPDINTYATVQHDYTTPGLPRATYNFQIGLPMPIFDQNKGNIITARAALMRATLEIPRVENDLRSRLADAFKRFETNRIRVTLLRERILPDAVRAYRGTYEKHLQLPLEVGFADVVVAQRSLLDSVSQYITTLTDQWNAFVDLSGLLQIESLKELQLQLKDKDAPAAPVDPEPEGDDVTSLVRDILTVTKTDKAKLTETAVPAAKPATPVAQPTVPVAKPATPVAKPAAVPVEQPEDEEELRIPPDAESP